MKILVTGATGFLGRHLAHHLLDHGYDVVAASRSAALDTGRSPPGAVLRSFDVRDSSSFADAFHGVDAVVHAAALVGDWGTREDFFQSDENGTRNVIEAARAAGVPRFVHVSSTVVYGFDAEGPVPESTPRVVPERCAWAYMAAKSSAEGVVEAARADGYPAVIVRPANVYGPRSENWTDRPARLALRGLGGVPSHHGFSNTVYVENVCALLEKCCTHGAAPGETFHAVDPGLRSWGEFFDNYAEALGKGAVPRWPAPLMRAIAWGLENVARISGQPPVVTRVALDLLAFRGYFPMAHAKEVLDWEPPVSADEGMRRTRAYLREVYVDGRARGEGAPGRPRG